MMEWNEPVGVLNTTENKADKQAGGRVKRLPWLIGLPIVFALSHPLMASNFKPINMGILFFVGLGIGAVIYIWGHSTTSMIQTIKINKKGILRIYIGAKMANHLIPWDTISSAHLEDMLLEGKEYRLLLLYGPEDDDLIIAIAIPESVTTLILMEEFDKYNCKLSI